ncbi:hypothetical protein JXO52_13135 [bacterium]|nr:hypothetical protein [bacterium]
MNVLLLAAAGLSYGQDDLEHFDPVENTGIHRAVVINAFDVLSYTLTEGDEVAVYDGDLCVGATKVTPNNLGHLLPLAISSILKVSLPNGTFLPGATNGNPILYRVWDKETNSEFQAWASEYSSGDGTFGQSYTVAYSLTAAVTLVTIRTNPAQLPFTLNGEEFITASDGRKIHLCNQGAVYTIAAQQICDRGEEGIRYSFNNWSDGKAISHTFVGPSTAWTITASFDTQYRLDAVSTFNNTHGSGWYFAGSTAQVSVDSVIVPAGTDRRYDFRGWIGTGGTGAYSGPDSVHTVTMNHPIIETAVWQKQFYLHTAESPVQCGNIYPDPPGRWYDQGAVAEVFAVGEEGFQLDYFSGVTTTPVGNTVMVTIDTSKSVTAYFKKEITIIIKTSPLNLEYTVDGTIYNISKSFTWFEGDVHTIGVPDSSSIQNEAFGERYEFRRWSDGGAQVHNYTVSDAEATVVAEFDTAYQLTLNAGPGSADGAGWYLKGSSASFSIDSEYTAEISGQRFRFTGWQGTDAGAYTGPLQSQTIVMNNPITQTALWKKQFKLTTVADPTAGGSITLNPSGGWYDENILIGVKAKPATGYQWSRWGGDVTSATDTVTVLMSRAKTATSYFAKVVQITVRPNPTGREFYVDGIKYTAVKTFTWFKDSTHTLLVSDSLQGEAEGTRYRFTEWSDGAPMNNTYIVPGINSTVTAVFQPQHYLDLNAGPGTATGEGWYDEGTGVSFHINMTAIEKGDCTRYSFNGWSGTGISAYTGPDSAHAVIMTNAITEEAVWGTEFLLEVRSAFGTASGEGWYEEGESATISVVEDTITLDVDERYYFKNWIGTGEGSYTGTQKTRTITIDTCIIETVNWQKQYTLTTRVKPPGTGTIQLSPAGAWYGSGSTWYDAGSTVSVLAVPGPADPFTEFTGDLTGPTNPQNLIISEPKEVTANFQDFIHLQVDADHEGVEFQYLNESAQWVKVATPHSFSTEEGESFSFRVNTVQTIGDTIRYTFDGWGDGPNDTARTITVPANDLVLMINVDAEYKVTIDSDHDSPTGAGWYDENGTASIAVTSPVQVDGFSRWVFTEWTGDHTGTSKTAAITVNAPKQIKANWRMQYLLTISSQYGNPYGHGWYFSGNTAVFGVTDPYMQSDSVRYKLIEWSGTGTGSYSEDDTTLIKTNVSSVVMNNPVTETATWERQNRLKVNIDPPGGGTVTLNPPGGWYRSGISVLLTPVESEGYLWGGWSGALTGLDRPKSLVMSFPRTVAAHFGTFVPIEVGTNPPGLGYYIDGTKFSQDSTFNLVIGNTYWFSTDSPQLLDGQNYIRYLFTDWSNRDDNDQGFKYVPSASEAITANFKKQYQLVVRSPHGNPYPDSTKSGSWFDDVLPPKSGTFGITTRTVEKNNNTRYVFKRWSSTSSGGYNGSDSVHTVSMVVPVIETAVWDTLYKLSYGVVPEGKGSIVVDPAKTWYAKGETVQLVTTLLDSSYQFDGWTGTTSSTNDTLNLVMNKSHSVLAEYSLVTHKVTTRVIYEDPDGNEEIGEGGTIIANPAPVNGVYNLRTHVRFSAVPESGYKFVGWSGALFGTSNPQDLYILSDTTVIARFMLADNQPPYISESYPETGSENLPVNTGLEFKVVDDIYGVNLNSLHITVKGVSIVFSGVPQPGAEIEAIDNGYRVLYAPAAEFGTEETVSVLVSCRDNANPSNQISNAQIVFKTGSSRILNAYEAPVPVQLTEVKVTHPDGVTITIPGGIIHDEMNLLIGKVDVAPDISDSTAQYILGSVYYFGPDGIQFSTPVKIVIPFPLSEIARLGIKTTANIKVYSYTTADKEWVEIPNPVVDLDAGTVTFWVSHFSYFRLSAATPHIAPGQIINWPNPFNPDGSGEESTTAIKYMLPNKTTVSLKIYDVSSQLVRVLQDNVSADAETEYVAVWDGKNGNGTVVANNVYFCVLSTGSGKVYVRKIVVLR